MSPVLTARYDPDLIKARLKSLELIREIHVFQSVVSTNTVARRLAGSSAPSGTLVLADRQTAGRGRHGRLWASPPGVGLWLSLLLRPNDQARHWPVLPLVLSEEIARSLRTELDDEVSVKWPNDVLYRGRKLCGILCEASFIQHRVDYVIAGIGININQSEVDFAAASLQRATSIRIITGERQNRVDWLLRLLQRFDQRLPRVLSSSHSPDLSGWRQLCPDIGKPITIHHGAGRLTGTFRDVNDDGHLLLQDGSGTIHIFHSAEVTVDNP